MTEFDLWLLKQPSSVVKKFGELESARIHGGPKGANPGLPLGQLPEVPNPTSRMVSGTIPSVSNNPGPPVWKERGLPIETPNRATALVKAQNALDNYYNTRGRLNQAYKQARYEYIMDLADENLDRPGGARSAGKLEPGTGRLNARQIVPPEPPSLVPEKVGTGQAIRAGAGAKASQSLASQATAALVKKGLAARIAGVAGPLAAAGATGYQIGQIIDQVFGISDYIGEQAVAGKREGEISGDEYQHRLERGEYGPATKYNSDLVDSAVKTAKQRALQGIQASPAIQQMGGFMSKVNR